MEDITWDYHGFYHGVAIHQWPGSRRLGPAVVCLPRVAGGPPDAPGRGGGSVLRRPEGYSSAPLPAVGKDSETASCAVHQPNSPVYSSRSAASEVQADHRYKHEEFTKV